MKTSRTQTKHFSRRGILGRTLNGIELNCWSQMGSRNCGLGL